MTIYNFPSLIDNLWKKIFNGTVFKRDKISTNVCQVFLD